MVKKRLIVLTILASISIIVLIVLQTYWVKKSTETQEKQFDQTVMDVMNNVVRKLDREEAVTRINNKYDIKDLQVGLIAINKAGEHGAYSIQPGFVYAVTNNEKTTVIDSKSLT